MPDRSAPSADVAGTDRGPGLGRSLWRGLGRRCPNCGRGALFRSYLRQVDACAACGEPFGHLRSDDAAPWLTILIVGHVVVPLAYAVERVAAWPEWVAMTLWPSLALAMTLAVLPYAKSIFLAVIWATRAPGSERE